MRALRRLPRPIKQFIIVLLAVALVDVMAAVYASAHQSDHPIPMLPQSLPGMPSALPRGVDGYTESPEAFGFSTTPGRPVLPAEGHVRVFVDGRRQLDPDSSLRYALAALAEHSSTGQRQPMDRAITAVKEVMRTTENGLVSHTIPRWDGAGEGLPTGWVSAETQGLLLSALSRLYTATGDTTWRSQASEVFDTLLRFRGGPNGDDPHYSPWLSYVDDQGWLWFEDLPQASEPTRSMTSHYFAVIGLYDFAAISSQDRAGTATKVIAAAAATGRHYTPQTWSAGAPYTSPAEVRRSWDRRHVLIAQLRVISQITDVPDFEGLSGQFADLVSVPQFATTGSMPRGDVDAYSGREAARAIPPTDPGGSPDAAAPERGIDPGTSPDARLASALLKLAEFGETDDREDLQGSVDLVSGVLDESTGGLVPHRFPAQNLSGDDLAVPWYSAQTQGLLLSALVRLEAVTDDQRWADEAAAVFATFRMSRAFTPTTPREAPPVWTSWVGDGVSLDYLWFEKFSPTRTPDMQDSPSYVIDAHICAIIGIYDYWRATRSPEAERLFDGGILTLVSRLPLIRRPGGPSETALQSDIFRLDHHRVVTRQLELLSRMTDSPILAADARVFAEDAS